MKAQLCRLWVAAFALTALLGSGTLSPTAATMNAKVFRWDIITFDSKGNQIPGGKASALADKRGGKYCQHYVDRIRHL